MEHTISAPRDGTIEALLYALATRSPRAASCCGSLPSEPKGASDEPADQKVTLVDVGPRDGLQNEKQPVATAAKVELVHRLQSAGLREIEVTSFASPRVPQMADNAEVMSAIARRPGVRYRC